MRLPDDVTLIDFMTRVLDGQIDRLWATCLNRRPYSDKWSDRTVAVTRPAQIKPFTVLNPKLPEMMIQMLVHQYRPLIRR